jgi:hypothetical protein
MNAETQTEQQPKPHRKFYNKWLYSLGLVVLSCAYIFLLSDSNISRHRLLNRETKKLEHEIAKVENLTKNDYTYEEISKNPKRLEQYVRENMNMQRPEEDVFVIEYK